MSGKSRNIAFLAVATVLALSPWFAASAVVPQLAEDWSLTSSEQSWMTVSVQLGFVVGALLSAISNLSDRISERTLFAVCAALAGVSTAAVTVFDTAGPALVGRFLTGLFLAGVYPPGMKLVASWCREDRGLGIGILVGALTLGGAMPHLLNAVPGLGPGGMPPWRFVLWVVAGAAMTASIVVLASVRRGPHLGKMAPFDWRFVSTTLREPAPRLANLGYLGHMWELYAVWTWMPIALLAAYESAGWRLESARLAAFVSIAAGAAGCVSAGALADRLGRARLAIWSLAISGACCVAVGLTFDRPGLLTAICLIWGFAVVADSAQFSAAISELADERYVGTALTLQTCLGFLLTMASVRLLPAIADRVGWAWTFIVLVPGPIVGILSMRRLRARPEAVRMAGGNR